MSRCFPFPPPGYVPNVIRDEALIESIKREEEKAKKEQKRKERKREKKDSKDNKEKKDKKDKKRKERERGEGESEKHSRKRRRKEEVSKDGKNDQKVDVFSKLKESENGCLDKSSLTVERELLQSTSQNSCDSTLNSNELLPKQQKEKQQPHNNDSESIIRIRLPIPRQNVPKVMMVTTTNKDQQKPCPIRRQNDPEVMIVTTNKDQKKPCPSQEIKLDPVKIVTREQPQQHLCSTSAPEQASKPQHPCSTSAPEHVSKPREEKRKDHSFTKKLAKEKKLSSTTNESSNGVCRFCPPSLAVQFLNVVENWVPNRVELTNSEDDECWWFMKKPSLQKFGTERCRQLDRNNETKQVISSSMAWPCARLLPEVDVHALPYTAPF